MRGTRASTTVTRELPDGTVQEIEVDFIIYPGEPQWFNALEGVGHPGSGPEAEVVKATLDGKEIELTDDEYDTLIEDVESRADEFLEDPEDARADYLYDQWKDERIR